MEDVIMWTLTGIALYLAIGYIFVYLTGTYDEGFWEQVAVMLLWPILVIIFVICCIYFGWKEINTKFEK